MQAAWPHRLANNSQFAGRSARSCLFRTACKRIQRRGSGRLAWCYLPYRRSLPTCGTSSWRPSDAVPRPSRFGPSKRPRRLSVARRSQTCERCETYGATRCVSRTASRAMPRERGLPADLKGAGGGAARLRPARGRMRDSAKAPLRGLPPRGTCRLAASRAASVRAGARMRGRPPAPRTRARASRLLGGGAGPGTAPACAEFCKPAGRARAAGPPRPSFGGAARAGAAPCQSAYLPLFDVASALAHASLYLRATATPWPPQPGPGGLISRALSQHAIASSSLPSSAMATPLTR